MASILWIYCVHIKFELASFFEQSEFKLWKKLQNLTWGLQPNLMHIFSACLLTFVWRWTCIAMMVRAEIFPFWLYQTLHYITSDLIQNIQKTSQVRWTLKIDTLLII